MTARGKRGVAGDDRQTSRLRTPPAEAPFDLVFLDPPYAEAVAETAAVLTMLAVPGWLTGGATVVIECRAAERPGLPPGWRVGRERAYGDTLLVVATVSAGP